MQLTDRDIKIFRKLNHASWLTTGQIAKYYFFGKQQNAVNKRMRKLVSEGYVFASRKSSTEEYLFRLANKGKSILINRTMLESEQIKIPKRLPQNLKHFVTINDLRYCFESALKKYQGRMLVLVTDHQLKRIKPNAKIIPDVFIRFQINTNQKDHIFNFFIEYDSGTENPGYFGKYKIKKYMKEYSKNELFQELSNLQVLIFADNIKRIISLMKCTIKQAPIDGFFFFATMEALKNEYNLTDPIFIDPFDYFDVKKDNNKIRIYEQRFFGENKIPFYSVLNLPVLSRCHDDRTG